MVTDQVLDRIRKELIDSGRDCRYKLPAYNFVLKGLEFYLAKIGEKRHVTGAELSRGFAEFASKQFGPMAWEVLCNWGVTCTDDFGYLVYNLIDLSILSRRAEDRLEDFSAVLDLEKYFAAQDPFMVDRNVIRSIKGA